MQILFNACFMQESNLFKDLFREVFDCTYWYLIKKKSVDHQGLILKE